jgi:hypothetical protein
MEKEKEKEKEECSEAKNIKSSTAPVFCNNCGKYGHMSYQCNTPITSIGIIAFRYRPPVSPVEERGKREYLIIRRKDTLGYIDFIRGKYSVHNKQYILNMFKQMTHEERQRILKYAREENAQDYGFKLWRQLWTNESLPLTPFPVPFSYSQSQSQYIGNGGGGGNAKGKYFKSTEEKISKEKFTVLANGRGMGKGRHPFQLQLLVDECTMLSDWSWDEPEWGFPKGRRDTEESDWVCALREFTEETGQPSDPNTIASQSQSQPRGAMEKEKEKEQEKTSGEHKIPPPPGLSLLSSLSSTTKPQLRPQSAPFMNVSVTIPSIQQKIQPITNLFPFEENFLGSNYKPYKHKYYLMKMDYEDSDITFLSTEVSKVAWKTYEECMEMFRFYNIEKKQMLTKIHQMLEHFTLV